MSTRSRSPKKREDELRFPIRVRIKVPEQGFGPRYDAMLSWLDENVGRGNYAWNADSLPGLDATAIYFFDPAPIAPFIKAMGLELVGWDLLRTSVVLR